MTRFAQKLTQRMKERGITLRELAEATGLTYEHLRLLGKGLAFPSNGTLGELCQYLRLNQHETEKLLVADRLEKKFGGVPYEIAGKHPELSLLAKWWDLLTSEQKQVVTDIIHSMADKNQHSSAKKRPRV